MRSRLLIVCLALALGAAGLPVAPARAAGCQFVLGFATLADLIPGIVGQCLENERHNPANGDGLQVTTNGLLVWRKADNFTAFTDGYRTWVNGPFGLQTRLNSERFFWEGNPDHLPVVPPPAPGDRCHTAGLSLALTGIEGGAGNFVGTFVLTNNLAVSCAFFGFVGAQLLDEQNNPLPTRVVRNGGPAVTSQPVPTEVSVPPGGTARFLAHWEDVPVGNETTCPSSSRLAVTPPDEFAPIVIPAQILACGGGELDVSPILPPVSG